MEDGIDTFLVRHRLYCHPVVHLIGFLFWTIFIQFSQSFLFEQVSYSLDHKKVLFELNIDSGQISLTFRDNDSLNLVIASYRLTDPSYFIWIRPVF